VTSFPQAIVEDPEHPYRHMVPREFWVPCEHSDAMVVMEIAVTEDGRVVAPALHELKAACAIGSVEIVTSFCQVWQRWLTRVERQLAERSDEASS
jgi:hypothetical protein